MKRAAVFLDRDGTINEEVGYLSDPDRLVLMPGAGQALRRINEAGMAAVIITNQSGVAREYFDEAVVESIHDRLKEELHKKGAFLDGIYYCPHHPEGVKKTHAISCTCRKPATGMLDQAVQNLSIDLNRSYMVGDHFKDIQLAANAGIRSVLVLTGHGGEEWARADGAMRSLPDHVARNLLDAVEWILADRRQFDNE